MLQQPAGATDFAGPALTEHGLGGTVHMILPKTEQALRAEVDTALDTMRSDGTFQRIIRRYMPFLAD
jgi:polar amino acid transport system substrate-binding protein/lysine/arginine/ornithine transport system substrate-binding protein/histidine transport system substrate-binding protein